MTNLQEQEMSEREHRSNQKLRWPCCACVSRSSFPSSTVEIPDGKDETLTNYQSETK